MEGTAYHRKKLLKNEPNSVMSNENVYVLWNSQEKKNNQPDIIVKDFSGKNVLTHCGNISY